VTDTGIGMSEEEIPLAISRFGQVEGTFARTYAGAGLGLSIVISLMELHGGTCHIESDKGVGTTVSLCFPAQRTVAKIQQG
jgi:signal transduction histidine kinase